MLHMFNESSSNASMNNQTPISHVDAGTGPATCCLYRPKIKPGCSKHQQKPQQDINSSNLAQAWVKYAINSWDSIGVKHKDQHLEQALLFKDHHMEVLLHSFNQNGGQSYIHNHKASFLSFCLNGSYVESKWTVDHESTGHYTVYCR